MFDDLAFLYPERVHLIWLALALVGLMGVLELRNREVLSRFVSQAMQARLADRVSMGQRIARLLLIMLGLTACVFALMRPQVTRVEDVDTSTYAAEIMVVLDLSKSMLASDAAPNRLERAKAELRDMLPTLKRHRVGLVGFAGYASVLCPLTTDHAWFDLALGDASPRSLTKGGTHMGDGIRKAHKAFSAEHEGAKVILLITDGEDHDSYPLEAAKRAFQDGVTIVAIGFGAEDGSEIVYVDPEDGAKKTLMHQGKPVISRLDGETLREIALATEGVYIPAGVSALDLDAILDNYVQPLVQETGAVTTREVRDEQYPYPVFVAMVSFLAAALVTIRMQGRR